MNQSSFNGRLSQSSCLQVAGMANLIILALTLITLLPLPDGSRIRPMGWAAAVFAISALTLLIGLIALLMEIAGRKSGPLLILNNLLLIASPFPLALLLLKLISALKGLQIAD